MHNELEKFLGPGPYPFSMTNTGEVMDIAFSSSMLIMFNKKGLSFSPEQGHHAHSSYEFILPLYSMPTLGFEKKTMPAELNRLMPINSDQCHGPRGYSTGTLLMGIQIDAKVVRELSRSIYKSSDVFFNNSFVTPGNWLMNSAATFMEEFHNRQTGYKFILESLSTQITVSLLRLLKYNWQEQKITQGDALPPGIRKALEFLNECYDKEYSLEDLASIANLSPYNFIQVFKSLTGQTPYKYLLDVKIKRAREMLKYPNWSITEICFACGFNNLSHFLALFKRKVGVAPSEYRKLINFR